MIIAKPIRRVLILGDTGFIGSRLKQFFVGSFPRVEVIGKSLPRLDLTKAEDIKSLASLLNVSTVVIMCAGIKKQVGDSLDSFSQNLQMAVNLCRLLRQRPVRRFIFFSSASVYGEDIENAEITENTPVQPTSYYGLAKYASERLFRKSFDDLQGSLVLLRPALVYGPCDPAGIYGPSGFIRAAFKGEEITLWGDGSERREFVFVDDLVKIVHRLTFQDYSGVLNVVSGAGYTFKQAVDIASRLAGGSVKVASRPRTKVKVNHNFDNTALRRLMPGLTFTSLEEGMTCTFEAEAQELDRPKDIVWGCS